MLIIKVSFIVFAALAFLFTFWKKLKEDYIQSQLFSSGFFCLFGLAFFGIISIKFAPVWTFWACLAGSFLGFFIGLKKYKFKFFEAFEAWVLGNLEILIVSNIYLIIEKIKLENIITLSLSLLVFFTYLYLDRHYKKFSWYRSGRVGFSGFAVLGLFFLIRSVVALTFNDMVFFVGKIDAIISAVAAFAAFLVLYNLSRSKI